MDKPEKPMEHALSANMKLEKLIVDAMVRTQERLFNALEELEGADEEASGAKVDENVIST